MVSWPGLGASAAQTQVLKLYFTRADNSGTNIYMINPMAVSASNMPQLITSGTTPNFSSDGSKMVFARASDGIYTSAPDGTGATKLASITQATDGSPSFNDAGTKIVYVSGGNIMVMNTDGTSQTALTSGGADRTPRWSHNGNTIYFARSGTLSSVSSSGGAVTAPGTANTLSLSSIAVRSDDSQLIYSRNGPTRGLYNYTIASGATSSLSTSLIGDGYPAFSPDQTQLVFSSTSTATGRSAVGGTGDLFLASIDASNNLANISNLTSSSTNEFAPVLALVPGSSSSLAAGNVLISQFRLSGPGGSGDEFIELVNNTDAAVDLSGTTVQASGTALAGLSLSGKSIPARGHFLLTNSNGYSLGSVYPSGTGTGYAVGDATYTNDIPLNATLSLVSGGTTLDSVSDLSSFVPNASNGVSLDQYAFVRRLESGVAAKTGSDTSDFNLVDTSSTQSTVGTRGTGTLTGARLGAPGPRNTQSPLQRNGLIALSKLNNPQVMNEAKYVSKQGTLDKLGRLSLRRTLKNTSSGTTFTRMRFRIVATTSGSNANGAADLRAISSGGVRYYDANNGNAITQAAIGMTLEAPSSPTEAPLTASSSGNGGGQNSSWTVALPSGGLAPGQSVNVEFLFGIAADGAYRVVVDTELLP